jgi:hypothetical protein
MDLAEVVSRRLRPRRGGLAQSLQHARGVAGQLPPGRCAAHADSGCAAPCPSCMRAQQQRMHAHYAASVAAAQEWQAKRASMTSAFF